MEQNICTSYLREIENDESNFSLFGDWINNIENLALRFKNAEPFGHIKIDNFLNSDYAEKLFESFPTDFENWYNYCNPIEVKFANDKINEFRKPLKDFFYIFSSKKLIEVFSKISNIQDLEYDPYLHGAGIHCHPRYGRLNMHLDYEKHPRMENKERRLNIILFLTKDWKEEWNGDNQLWSNDMKKCMVKTYPKFNSAIIFQTNNISWHGLPEKILCPENIYRKSVAYYYISPLTTKSQDIKFGNDGTGYRTKAAFIKRPDDPNLPQMEKLYNIRPHRRIEKKDMDEIWPEWNPELF